MRTTLCHSVSSAGKRLLEPLYKAVRNRVYAIELSPSAVYKSPLNVSIHTTVIEDPALQSALKEGYSWNPVELARRERLGDRCYTVRDMGRCVHFSWVTVKTRQNTELGYKASLNDREAWIYDCFTATSHRGKGLYPRVLQTIISDSLKQDRERIWIDVDDSNIPSIRGIEKAGFSPVALLEKKMIFNQAQGLRSILRHERLGQHLNRLLACP